MAPETLDDEDFLRSLRASVAAADPAPPDVSAIAKLAFEMRGVQVVRSEEALAGVRSAAMGSVHRVRGPHRLLTWSIDGALLTGLLQPSAQRLAVRTMSEVRELEVEPETGAFETAVPTEPWRLEVRAGRDVSWSTEWQSPRAI